MTELLNKEHPIIVKLVEYWLGQSLDGTNAWYLVLQNCSHGSLEKTIKTWTDVKTNCNLAGPDYFVAYIIGMASALALLQLGFWDIDNPDLAPPDYAPLIHQDIKPGDIIPHWSDKNLSDVILGDLDSTERETDAKSPYGTHTWNPPEVRRARENYKKRPKPWARKLGIN
ncbi:hypothetical protein K470DRAFT_294460 [Piedraia hortae CBS 480.64]|uniref:Protein kinase domain-containing protein n=1 Tax=Piedraia hortae CBS 480.64 TaxID=1314780 RepID=A0A6A7C2A7_9PEZI|nr:hypothetical protein K470DRAFT_294460 [Piedraia hortae CBS 480.64]